MEKVLLFTDCKNWKKNGGDAHGWAGLGPYESEAIMMS